jgi:hypothetical protein
MILRALLQARRLARQCEGTMAIETAIVAPVLIVLAIGGFEISSIVARQTELQSAAAEASAVVRAALPETAQARTAIRDIVMTSTGLTADQVSVAQVFRCGTDENYVASEDLCGEGDNVSTYIEVAMSDTYQPLWTHFGVGGPMDFSVSRTIQVA